jgi:RND superfamily putative drug exporter
VHRSPLTVRIASWSARHRWPVFLLWFVFTIGLFGASLAGGGTQIQPLGSGNQNTKLESDRAYELYGGGATTVEEGQQYLLLIESPAATLDDPAFAAAVRSASERLRAVRVDAGGPALEQLVDPFAAPPEVRPVLVSPDRHAIRIAARVKGSADEVERKLRPVTAELQRLRQEHPDLTMLALNNTLANDEILDLVSEDLDRSLLLTVPLTFAILLIAFGALVAAAVPLVLAGTALAAAFGVLNLYSQYIAPVPQFASQLVVLIGLAVSVDYSLFLITRFRAERRRGHLKLAAIDIASGTAGRAIVFSGLAVMLSIGGLYLLDDPTFNAMATGTIAVVLIAVIGSLTFLPATLAILGRGVDLGRIPYFGRSREEGSGAWSRLVRLVTRRPVLSAVASGAFLLLLASPFLRLHVGSSDLSAFPSSLESVRALELLNRRWPGGSTVNLQVVVTRANEPAVQRAIADFSQRVLSIPGVSGPPETKESPTTHAQFLSYLLPGTPNDESNRDIVRRVRSETVPAVFGSLPGVQALVTGDVAATLDEVNHFRDALPRVFAFVLGLSFLLLLIAFRSLVIPIKAILLNLLSTAAAYGALVLVFQEGWFANVLDVKPGVVEDFVPLFIFTILFGLSMDYHVFILMRIKEAHDRGVSSNEAVVRGISITSGTVTSAAAIMVCVFAVFVTLRLAVVKEIGLGLAVAVFLDATVVRSVLLPSTMRMLGEWNWWLPRWLSWIPRVTLETDSLAPGTLRPAPAGSLMAAGMSAGTVRPMQSAGGAAVSQRTSPVPIRISRRGRALLVLAALGVGVGALVGGILRGNRRR